MKKNYWGILTLLVCIIAFSFQPVNSQTMSLDNVESSPGQNINLPLNFSGLNNVGAITLFIGFDENVLSFSQISNQIGELQGVLANVMSNPTRLAVSWFAMSGGVNFPDGKVADLTFSYSGGECDLIFDPVCEVVDWNLNVINVTYVNGSVSPLQGEPVSVWNGTGNWTETQYWSNGIPGAETKAIISTGLCSINSGAVALKMVIDPVAGISVLPASSLTVSDSLRVAGTFTLVSDITGTGSFIGNGAIEVTGQTDIQRFITGGSLHEHLFSSPVQQSIASTFAGSVLSAYDEVAAVWNTIQASDNLIPGKGYIVSPSADQTAHFSGQLNNTNFDFLNLTQTQTTSTDWPSGFHAVGNPFTSAIDWTLGDWVKNGVGSSVYTWNGTEYVAWNGLFGSFSNGIIPTMQGFFVQAINPDATLTLPLNSRVHNSQAYYKDIQDIDNLLVLNAENENNINSQLFINFNDAATDSFDPEWDAHKLPVNAEAPFFYSLASSGQKLCIDVQPSKAYTDVPLQLGFKVNTTGTWSIAAELIQNFSADIPIYLKDTKTNDTLNLRVDTVYTFTAQPADNPNRFLLYFTTPPDAIFESGISGFKVYQDGGSMMIHFGSEPWTGSVRVYDISGRIIMNESVHHQNTLNLPCPEIKGLYLLNFNGEGKSGTTRFIVQ